MPSGRTDGEPRLGGQRRVRHVPGRAQQPRPVRLRHAGTSTRASRLTRSARRRRRRSWSRTRRVHGSSIRVATRSAGSVHDTGKELRRLLRAWLGRPSWHLGREDRPQRGRSFTSFGSELSAHRLAAAVEVFRRLTVEPGSIGGLPHASSKRDWDNGAEVLGSGTCCSTSTRVRQRRVGVGGRDRPRQGEGEIRRGDRLVASVGSAGMSSSVCSFLL